MRRAYLPLCVLTFLLILGASAGVDVAAAGTYVEDFTTRQYCNTEWTRAVWDTVAGEVRLPPFHATIEGTYDTLVTARDVAVSGDYAYVAGDAGGLRVIDITFEDWPRLVGTYMTAGDAWGVAVSGDYAFVAAFTAGLEVIDISDPKNPTYAGSYYAPGEARAVAIDGNYAYVAGWSGGFHVIDISSPTTPSLAATYTTPDWPLGVAVSGDYAYIAASTAGLYVLDISNPVTPAPAGSVGTWDLAHGVAISGDYAYVTDWSSGLHIIDITDPTSPVEVNSHDTPDGAYSVTVSADRAYVCDFASGVQVINVADPTMPTFEDSCDTPGNAHTMAISGEYAYVADGTSGLQVLRIAFPTDPTLAGSCAPRHGSWRAVISGDYAYVADSDSGLQVLDISDPASPVSVGNCPTPDEALGVAVSGDFAYIACSDSGLIAVDITDPELPVPAGACAIPGHTSDVVISGDYAYVANWGAGLRVVDISDPTNPVLAGICDTGAAWRLAVSGDYVYVADEGSGLRVIDISFPTVPTLVATHSTPGYAECVTISGDYAFIGTGALNFFGVYVVDITDPTAPAFAGSSSAPGPIWEIAVSGDYAYLAAGGAGLQVRFVGGKEDSVILYDIGSYDIGTQGYTEGVKVSGDYAYVAAQSLGLLAVEVSQRLYDIDSFGVVSREVDDTEEDIVSARVSATQVDSVYYRLSGQGGWTWVTATQGQGWYELEVPGDTLMWAALLTYAGGGINPTCSYLRIDWRHAYPVIDSVTDVPNDQGRQVSVSWSNSGYDFVGSSEPVTEYAVYRRIDPDLTLATARGGPETLKASQEQAHGEDGPQDLYPPGDWHFLMTVPAVSSDNYAVVVPTLADSTVSEGAYYTTFCVLALTGTPGVYFESPVDSGYSLDNLAPSPPQNLRMPTALELAWDECEAGDFDYFTAYGSMAAELGSTATVIGHTIETSMDVGDDLYDYYYVTATDFSGNEGDASSIENGFAGIEGVDVLPAAYALRQNLPNPFESSTQIAFDLPEPCPVRLEVLDVSGRLVRTLTDEQWPAGWHSVVWTGTNDTGQRTSSGVYFVRLEAGDFRAVRKVLLLQ